MYDSTIGRFRSEDPIRFAAGDVNIQRYVGNSPTNATDPSGLQEVKPSGGKLPTKIELERARTEYQRQMKEYELAMAKYDRELFLFYQRLMKWLVVVGDHLNKHGVVGLNKIPGDLFPISKEVDVSKATCTNAKGSEKGADGESKLQTTPNAGQQEKHFPIKWDRLSEAMKYSYDNYGRFEHFVFRPSSSGSWNLQGYAIPMAPRIDTEAFRRSPLQGVGTLIHEPLHDLEMYGPSHAKIKDIVPTGGVGGFPTSKFGSDLEMLFDFLRETKIDGTSLLDYIIRRASPPKKPTEPQKPAILQGK